jgi:hypothetical protein
MKAIRRWIEGVEQRKVSLVLSFQRKYDFAVVFALTNWRGLRYARGQEEYEKPEVSHVCCRRFF